MKAFDQTEAFDKEIKPLLEWLAKSCQLHGISIVASCCYGHAGEGEEAEDFVASIAFGSGERTPESFRSAANILAGTHGFTEVEVVKE